MYLLARFLSVSPSGELASPVRTMVGGLQETPVAGGPWWFRTKTDGVRLGMEEASRSWGIYSGIMKLRAILTRG